MTRLARVVVSGVAVHVTHRGNRREDVFFVEADREAYSRPMSQAARKFDPRLWGYCLLTNHMHWIALPRREDSLAKAIGLAHGRYSRRINAARGWTGHLWAGPFFSTALDEDHLWTAIRYVELNPVRAGLVKRAAAYRWSSARSHAGRDSAAWPLKDGPPNTRPSGADGAAFLDPKRPVLSGARDEATGHRLPWKDWLGRGLDEEVVRAICQATRTDRPLDSASFIERLKNELNRMLAPQKRGRKQKLQEEKQREPPLFW